MDNRVLIIVCLSNIISLKLYKHDNNFSITVSTDNITIKLIDNKLYLCKNLIKLILSKDTIIL